VQRIATVGQEGGFRRLGKEANRLLHLTRLAIVRSAESYDLLEADRLKWNTSLTTFSRLGLACCRDSGMGRGLGLEFGGGMNEANFWLRGGLGLLRRLGSRFAGFQHCG
jgi:hypothetical protein